MSQQTKRQLNQTVGIIRNPVAEYISELEKIYPRAIGVTEVIRRHDNRVIVAVPLPEDEDENIWLFDKMSEVGTKLLLETDEYIILSGQ